MVGLQACSSGPTGFMTPTTNVPEGASRVDMLVVTTRKPSEDPNVLFTGERGFDYSIDEVAVSLPPASARTPGQVQWPRTSTPDPTKEFAVLSVQRRTLEQTDEWFEKQAGVDGRLMIFVHGFNTRFGVAVFRYAQIIKDSGAPVAPVLFTWPSRGGIYSYNYDRESTNFSRDALEAGLLRAAHNDKVKEITVLAHSMGAWLAMEALRQSAIREGRVPAKVTAAAVAADRRQCRAARRDQSEPGALSVAAREIGRHGDRHVQAADRGSAEPLEVRREPGCCEADRSAADRGPAPDRFAGRHRRPCQRPGDRGHQVRRFGRGRHHQYADRDCRSGDPREPGPSA